MILYANGCSMTYGSELVDEGTGDPALDSYRLAHAWPGRLGDFLDAKDVVNDAKYGGSNDRILRTTIRWLLDHYLDDSAPQTLVVVGWTGAMRREFYIDGEYHQVIPYHQQTHPQVKRLTDVYRNVAWNDHECGDRLATQILSLQSFLVLHRIPYLFFDSIESSFDTLGRAGLADSSCAAAIDRTRYYRFGDADGSMADVLRAGGASWYGRHPAEDGHELWAHKLAAHIVGHQLLQRPGGQSGRASSHDRPLRTRRTFRRANQEFLYP